MNELRVRAGGAPAPTTAPASADAATAALFQQQMTAATLSGMAAADDPDGQNSAQSLSLGDASTAAAGAANPYAALHGGGLNTQAALLAQLQGASGGGTGLAAMMSANQGMGTTSAPLAQTTAPTMVRGKTDKVDPELLSRLDALGRELGQPIDIISGNRTRAEQAELYRRYQNGTGNLAAPPGQSNHEHGDAADAYVNGVALANFDGAREAAQRLGLHFPVGGEAWHVERVDR